MDFSPFIEVFGGGALVGIVTLIVNQYNKQRETRSKEIDDRIDAWQKIANENKERFTQMEKRLFACEHHTQELQTYIIELERLIVQTNSDIEIPKNPCLDCTDCLSEESSNAANQLQIGKED